MTKGDVERIIKEILEENLQSLLEAYLIEREKKYENISLLERVVRVEEGILRIEKRFEDLQSYMDKRFEAVEKRFEDMNKRFEDMNKRLAFISWFIPTIITIVIAVLKFIQV